MAVSAGANRMPYSSDFQGNRMVNLDRHRLDNKSGACSLGIDSIINLIKLLKMIKNRVQLILPLWLACLMLIIYLSACKQKQVTQVDYKFEKEYVDTTVINQIADTYARMLWGNKIARDLPIPMFDKHGNINAYLYQFILDESQFNQEEILIKIDQVLSKVETSNEQDQVFLISEDTYYELTKTLGEFGALYISATNLTPPVIGVTKSLHPYYINGRIAQRKAGRVLENDNANLIRIYFLGVGGEYYEFASLEKNILIRVNDLTILNLEEVINDAPELLVDPNAYGIVKEYWKYLSKSPPIGINVSDLADVVTQQQIVIMYDNLIPIINWTWWCVPTAVSMVVGYWDNYVPPAGSIIGYGLLNKYWFKHSTNGSNVPDFIDELIDPKTGSWRTGYNGLGDLLDKRFGYKFSYTETAATLSNNFNWSKIQSEIAAGRPFVWSTYTPNHANTAFGYKEDVSGKLVIAYNTWGATSQQQYHEWNYLLCKGIGTLVPIGNPTYDQIILDTPRSKDVLSYSSLVAVNFFIWGTSITKVDLDFSTDDGSTWNPVVKNIVAKSGWNNYQWQPISTTSKGRLRIKAYDTTNQLISADGSHDSFVIH